MIQIHSFARKQQIATVHASTVHASAPSFETTDWAQIVHHCDQLCDWYPSPVATLNRIIALRYARGAEAALLALRASSELHGVQESMVYHATLAKLHEVLEDQGQAAAFRAAAELAESGTLAELSAARRQRSRRLSLIFSYEP